MKKILYTSFMVLTLVFITPNVNAEETIYYTNYENIQMTESEYNNLLQLGFTEDEIYQMNYQTFVDNKDLNATLVSETTKYYKTTTVTKNGVSTSTTDVVTKAQYEQGVQEQKVARSGSFYDGLVETNYKLMRTNISQIDEYQYRYKVTLNWTTMPSTRSHDIIGIGFQQAYVQLNSSVHFQQNYTYSTGSSASSVTCVPLSGTMGGSAVFKLPTGSLSKLSSMLYYNVRKANDNNTVTHMDAGGDYSHATSTISETMAQRHSVNHSAGIILQDSIVNYYDDINVATASWYGTW